MRTSFRSGQLCLEGHIELPSRASAAAVICHPHPQYGGDMDSPVVRIAAEVLAELGFATLCFNFRGVGASDGSFDHGVGEVDDALAALQHLREVSGIETLTLAGYSFGSMVAIAAAPRAANVDRLLAIAPPLAFFDLSGLADYEKAKLFVLAEHDNYCDVAAASRQIGALPPPAHQRVVAGADHFFATHTAGLKMTIRELQTVHGS